MAHEMYSLDQGMDECRMCGHDSPAYWHLVPSGGEGWGYPLCEAHATGILLRAFLYVSVNTEPVRRPHQDDLGGWFKKLDRAIICVYGHGASEGWMDGDTGRFYCPQHAGALLVELTDHWSFGGPPPPDPRYIDQRCPLCGKIIISQGVRVNGEEKHVCG